MCLVCRYLPDEDINNYIVSRIVKGQEDPVFNTFIFILVFNIFQYPILFAKLGFKDLEMKNLMLKFIVNKHILNIKIFIKGQDWEMLL